MSWLWLPVTCLGFLGFTLHEPLYFVFFAFALFAPMSAPSQHRSSR